MPIPQSGIFSGSDMVAAIYVPVLGKHIVFGELSTISYSIHRELYPVRSLGRVNAKGYTRGARTIAGSLIFTVFNKHILYDLQKDIRDKYNTMLSKYNYRGYNLGSQAKTDQISGIEPVYLSSVPHVDLSRLKIVSDEMPPFDVIITMANEYDDIGSHLIIRQLRITNEGQTMSIEDMMIENVMQYLATGIELMEPTG